MHQSIKDGDNFIPKSETSFTQLIKNISQGEWIQNLNRIKLDKIRGKFIHHMGYLSDYGKTVVNDERLTKYDFLYPEEGLFLTENSNLLVHLNLRESQLKVHLSIEQIYELFFRQKRLKDDSDNDKSQFHIDLNCYKIYSNLVKNGYIVRRAKSDRSVTTQKQPTSCELNPNKEKPSDIEPLVNRYEHERLSQFEIYKKLNRIIPNMTLDELKDRVKADETKNCNEPLFDVNQPDKRFQKSKTPRPDFKIFSQRSNETSQLVVPELEDFIANSDHKVQIYGFTDDANHPIYYSFDFNFSIPFIVKE